MGEGIIGRSFDRFDHFPNGLVQPYKDRAADDVVADVEFCYLGYGRERTDIAIGQAVAGSNDQAEIGSMYGRGADAVGLRRGFLSSFTMSRSRA